MAILKPTAATLSTMAQGPTTPWRNEDEAEEYAADPKEFMLERCRLWMDNAEFFRSYVIAATYYLPAFDMLGGKKFFKTDASQDEALWQGKVGLVVGIGPLAFVDEGHTKFGEQRVEIGDWIQWDIHDARQFTINRIHCRFMQDTQVIARLKDPRLVY